MENEISDLRKYKLGFDGRGSSFLGIILVNWILKVITLGFYQPWAKAKELKYLYSSASLDGDRFAFNGTGKEMFRGYIKAFAVFVLIVGINFLLFYLDLYYIALIFFYFTIIIACLYG